MYGWYQINKFIKNWSSAWLSFWALASAIFVYMSDIILVLIIMDIIESAPDFCYVYLLLPQTISVNSILNAMKWCMTYHIAMQGIITKSTMPLFKSKSKTHCSEMYAVSRQVTFRWKPSDNILLIPWRIKNIRRMKSWQFSTGLKYSNLTLSRPSNIIKFQPQQRLNPS